MIVGKTVIKEVAQQGLLQTRGDYFMGEKHQKSTPAFSASTLLERLFNKELADFRHFDPEVLAIVKQHLGQGSLHSKAGSNLASALVQLATQQTEESKK